jgi:protein farnesyltransferase subunit beta
MESKEKHVNKNKDRTLREQKMVEEGISKIFRLEGFDINIAEDFSKNLRFEYEYHLEFAKKMIRHLSGSYAGIDAGLPWFSYWVLNIFDMCSMNKYELSYDMKIKFVNYLKELQHPEGGFSGYNYGHAHLVSNYAAVMAIINLDMKEAYEIIDREKMKNFLKRMKNNNFSNKTTSFSEIYDKNGNFLISKGEDNLLDKCSDYKSNSPGSFQMHVNGESDLRATYCALTVAHVLNILDEELLEGVIENIKLCQTFEGGLGPEPFCEAHGGYSFCGIATLVMLNKLDSIDVNRFIHWLVNKQMSKEGGFQGRTNKLVDSCYSFWQGSIFNLLAMDDEKKYTQDHELLYNQLALQAYILMCCQNLSGGLWDKPGKPADLFHTNYATAGLALSQKCFLKDEKEELKVMLSFNETLDFNEINPIYCVSTEKVERAKNYFWNLDNSN